MHGPGTDTLQVSYKDGLVVLHFDKPVEWVALDPNTAGRMAESVARTAYTAVSGDVPTTEKKSQITEQIRVRLRNRVALMIGSAEREAPRPDAKILATRLVDECLKELA